MDSKFLEPANLHVILSRDPGDMTPKNEKRGEGQPREVELSQGSARGNSLPPVNSVVFD